MATLLTAFAISAKAVISPETMALAKAVAAELAEVKTIRLTASHKIDPGRSASAKPGKGGLNITMRRELACDVKIFSRIQPE